MKLSILLACAAVILTAACAEASNIQVVRGIIHGNGTTGIGRRRSRRDMTGIMQKLQGMLSSGGFNISSSVGKSKGGNPMRMGNDAFSNMGALAGLQAMGAGGSGNGGGRRGGKQRGGKGGGAGKLGGGGGRFGSGGGKRGGGGGKRGGANPPPPPASGGEANEETEPAS